MNTLYFLALLAHAEAAPLMVKILFWVILVLAALGIIIRHDNPHFLKVGSFVILLLIGILGYCTLGF